MGNFEIGDDIIDVRDIIERVENLRLVCSDEEVQELQQLESILDELAGNGGDEQWEGDWYPLTLIAEHHFTNYARELAEDCGMVNGDSRWPNNCIDWEEAARQLKTDYTEVSIGGSTYYFR